MKFEIQYATNTGRIRKNNEDSLLAQVIFLNKVSMDAPAEATIEMDKVWFIVADGMGGVEAGEEASGETLRHLQGVFPSLPGADQLRPALEGAKNRLNGIADQKKAQLGTTIAGLFLDGSAGFAFNVGDCRVYKLNGGFLNRITRDHSLLEEATAAGLPTESIPKNVVTSAIMGGDREPMNIFSRNVQVKPNDRFLVCSDGLWGALAVEEMEEAFKLPTLQEIAGTLLSKGVEKSEDNVTFILIRVVG